MKITIYELLGMIKDGKAPKRIIYDQYVYAWNKKDENYTREIDIGTSLNWDYIVINCLNEPVEILEEEKKIPEKLEDKARFQYSEIPTWLEKKEIIKAINENFEKHQKAIYEIIDYLDYLKSKGE